MEFDPKEHTYTQDGKEYKAVTKILEEQGITPSFSGVNPLVLEIAREKGNLIHKELEMYIKDGNDDFLSAEAPKIAEYLNSNFEDCDIKSELMVWSDKFLYAGTIDICILKPNNKYTLLDIKTGNVEKNVVKYQLSLYAKAITEMDAKKVDEIIVLECKDNDFKAESLEFVPNERLEELLRCSLNGGTFNKVVSLPSIIDNKTSILANALLQAQERVKELEAEFQNAKETIYKTMEEKGIDKATSVDGSIEFTRVAPAVQQRVDSARLKKEQPSIYEEYSKQTNVKGYVKIAYSKEK